jgi:uncharacterized protein
MASTPAATVCVEVAFATPEKQLLKKLHVPEGASVAQVLERSDLARQFPDLVLADTSTGIWGRLVDADHQVKEGDRVELYRPLVIDPREARRELAVAGRTMGARPR